MRGALIRSFVRREGRITKGQQAALKRYWPVYGVEAGDDLLNLPTLFDNSRSVVLDIGFGNGEALVLLAEQYPQLNFLGVEVYRPGIGSLLRRLAACKLQNVRVVNADAVALLRERLADGGLLATLIWFPDPWPKLRHHKRRLIQHQFVRLLAAKLVDAGELHIATDWRPYAQHIQDLLRGSKVFREVRTSEVIGARPATKFERRSKLSGHQIFAQVYKKLPRL